MVGTSLGIIAEKGTKNQIIQVLSEQWPLSAKQIHNELKKKHSITNSYQATHKSLKQLEESKIVGKNNNQYNLSLDWINKLKDASEQLHKSYSNPKNKENSFVVDSLYEADMFILDFVSTNLPEGKKTEMGWLWSHYWIPLFLSMKEYQKIQVIAEKAIVYSGVRGNTIVDKWCADFWEQQGVKTICGLNIGSKPDTIAFDNLVIQVFYPKEIMEEVEKFFSSIENLEDLNAKYLFEKIFDKKIKIPITITKNKELANQIIEETKNYFETK